MANYNTLIELSLGGHSVSVPEEWARQSLQRLYDGSLIETISTEIPQYIDENGNIQYMSNDLTFYKYYNGNAYYYCTPSDIRKDRIVHLLSGDTYTARWDSLEELNWADIPKSFKMDAIANNPKIRKIYGETNQKEETKMFDNENFDFGRFGQINSDEVRMSPKGLAIEMTAKNGKTKYRAWDREKNIMVDVTGITMPLKGMLFVMPAKKLEVGDIIEHDGEFVFVQAVGDDGAYTLLGSNGGLSEHIKTVSFMGFNFYRKVVTPMKRFGSGAGGIMEMMKMQMMMGMMNGGDRASGGLQNIMMMQMMSGKNAMGDLFDLDSIFDMGSEDAES